MRSTSAGLAVAFTTAAMVLGAGCSGSSSPAGTAGHDGGAGQGGSTGTAGAAGGGTGTAGAGGTGTAGAAGGGTGTAGAAGGSAGAAGGAGGATGGTGGTDWPFDPVTIPADLMQAGTSIKFKLHAIGVQIYTCAATTAAGDGGADAGVTTYAWTLKAPSAKLYDTTNAEVGSHYGGPTWMSKDGSDVVGARVASVNSPLADAIPWLLLKAASHMGSGVMANVTYVQRVNTKKGKAPATGCDAAAAVGMETSVDYTADYYFLTGGGSADGGVTADWPFTAITIPTTFVLPAEAMQKMKAHAIGAQIYTCTASGGADAGADAGAVTYAWTLKAPDAKLYDDTNTELGTHGVGPNWTSKDGSVVVGARLFAADSPLTDAIPWLELKAASHSGTAGGVFSDVTYVLRVNTTKGKAPASGCAAATVGAETSVPYTADYYFYKGDAPADGGTGG